MRPIASQFNHIHKAIGGELLKLEGHAASIDPSSAESVAGFAGHLAFMEGLLNTHAREEDNGLFPAIEAKFPGMMATFSYDHEAQDKLFDALRSDVASLQGEAVEDKTAIARRLHRNMVALSSDLILHMEKEEAVPYARFAETLSEEEELGMVGAVLNSLPDEMLTNAMPWMASYLTDDEILDEFETYKRVLGAAKMRTFVAPLSTGLAPGRWEALTAREPGLVAAAAG